MRRLMWFTVGFAAACAVAAYAYSAWLWIVALLALCLFVIGMLLHKRWKVFSVVVAICLGILSGLLWFGAYRTLYLSPATVFDGSNISVTAEVTDYSVSAQYGVTVQAKLRLEKRTYRAVLYLKDHAELKPGDSVTGTFRLRMTHEGLEGDTYHRGNGIFLLAYAQDQCTIQTAEKISLRYIPAMMRHTLTEKIDALFPDDTGFFAKALLLSDRSDMDYETNTAFKVSGISHVVAVSGLHVSILFSVIFFLVARKRDLTALFGIPVLILFAAITGFTPSVTRACVMQILMILADLILQEYDSPTALSAAVLLMLLVNPVVITSASLQLSVGCMIGIFLFSEKIKCWICNFSLWKNWKGKSPKGRLRNWFSSGVSITVSAMFFTTPLVAYYFGSVSLIGVVTNLATLWVISWIFYGVMMVCVLSFIWQQGAFFLAGIISWLIRYVLAVSGTLSKFPLAAVYTKSGFIIAWLALCYLLVVGYMLLKKRKPYLLICSVVTSLSIALLLSWIVPLTDASRVTVLNVGQGQSVLLQSHGKTFLVDCGGDDPEKAADMVAETLLSMGIYRLDGVILTHYDGDHSGGIPYLLSRIPSDVVYLTDCSEEEEMKQIILSVAADAAVMVHQDLQMSWDEVSLTIFAPLKQSDDNESGLSVLFRGENCDILLTGDMDIGTENKLILEKDIPKLTALVAGHHGSPYSTGEGLLTLTKPQYVFISVGEDNPYGHPHQQVLDRLEQHDCTVLRTDFDGTIVFRR